VDSTSRSATVTSTSMSRLQAARSTVRACADGRRSSVVGRQMRAEGFLSFRAKRRTLLGRAATREYHVHFMSNRSRPPLTRE
jgi:hypothetical protein